MGSMQAAGIGRPARPTINLNDREVQMRILNQSAIIALGLLGGAALAQDAFTPPPPTAQENAAVDVVTKWANLLEQGKAIEAYKLYVSPNFVEHDDFARGKKQTVDDIAKMLANDPLLTKKMQVHIAQVVRADDDLVFEAGRIGVDVFQVENGKITAHWNLNVPDSKMTVSFPGVSSN
jgi:predicted SnoaL-like aldol condensation-catalyzing enzyme